MDTNADVVFSDTFPEQIAYENRDAQFLSLAVRKLKVSAVLTTIFALFLIVSSFL